MRKVSIVAALMMMMAALGCKAKDKTVSEPAVSDSSPQQETLADDPKFKGLIEVKVLKIDRREVSENSVLKLELRHIIDPASRGTETLETKSMPVTELPVNVTIPYEKSEILKRDNYVLFAGIYDQNGKLIHATDGQVPILTYGAFEKTQVILKPRNLIRETFLARELERAAAE